jgi:hypothetical protein
MIDNGVTNKRQVPDSSNRPYSRSGYYHQLIVSLAIWTGAGRTYIASDSVGVCRHEFSNCDFLMQVGGKKQTHVFDRVFLNP